MRKRDIARRIKEAQDGAAACEGALSRFPRDPVFTRSWRMWDRTLSDAHDDMARHILAQRPAAPLGDRLRAIQRLYRNAYEAHQRAPAGEHSHFALADLRRVGFALVHIEHEAHLAQIATGQAQALA
jgi:hypothetical protein